MIDAFGPMPTLETPRLALRPLAIDDVDAVFTAYASDPEVAKYMMWEAHASTDVTREFVEKELARVARGEPGTWALLDKATGGFVGVASLFGWDTAHHRVELGYCLGRAWWGRGLAAEAGAALVALAFERGAERVEALAKEPNAGSQRVLEKLGFTLEGRMRAYRRAHGRAWDYRMYARLAEDRP